MGFLDMGMGEILLIVVIALILLGPEKVPGIARTMGRALRNFRKVTTDFTTTLTREIAIEEKKQVSPSVKKKENKSNQSTDDTTSEDKKDTDQDDH